MNKSNRFESKLDLLTEEIFSQAFSNRWLSGVPILGAFLLPIDNKLIKNSIKIAYLQGRLDECKEIGARLNK